MRKKLPHNRKEEWTFDRISYKIIKMWKYWFYNLGGILENGKIIISTS